MLSLLHSKPKIRLRIKIYDSFIDLYIFGDRFDIMSELQAHSIFLNSRYTQTLASLSPSSRVL
ncbi:uncharacterized protein MYCFIDRAFT_212577 [Pseudocercospora fijiensis CIRAD86]|uniref:Uncharacterized protein n=1 Tax=Pseudocercospora fijiensis (strain CIRAD86) TaxID=383855 RepID=M3AK76_PSEFD|nr:uncharacterized protein MYCFIDRAFT_212577 [Pseudocercospora fijiensis CIRAD86]EME77857.1 hypothetical protein MYCFIDRAFT_212577 [Pseudocercospora fijiensis CIRAD86]